jgi:2-polyprenyl-6-methoxyphenol hydroxylase-like FAD-dependent oxidoreductase
MSIDVVICGAGVAGLACARALGDLGLRVLVLDRRAEPAEVPKGEVLQPESVRILDRFGALAALRGHAAAPADRLAIRDPHGRPLLELDYTTLPGDYRQILCAAYTDVLRAIEGVLDGQVEVRRGVRVDGLLRDDDGRICGVRITDGGVPAGIRARLVVAADGQSSRLREAAGLPVRRRAYPHRLLALEVRGVEVGPEVSAYRADRGLRLVYPLPGGRCRLYVQVRPDELRGTGPDGLTAWADEVLAEVPALAPIAGAVHAQLRRRQILAIYRLRAPRLATAGLALVGEAAHAVHPMAAQGVNSSLADAETLASVLAAGGGTEPAAVDRALRRYAAQRRRRLDHISTVSHNAARMLTSLTGPARLLSQRMMRHTAANPRLLRVTAGNLSGIAVRPLNALDRIYQLGLLPDRAAAPASTGEAIR